MKTISLLLISAIFLLIVFNFGKNSKDHDYPKIAKRYKVLTVPVLTQKDIN